MTTTRTPDRTRTFPLTQPIRLNARLGHGSLTVTAADPDAGDLQEARVTLTPRGGDDAAADRVVVQMTGTTLAVLAPRQGGLPGLFADRRAGRGAVDAEITVPSGTDMRLSTFSGDVTVRGRAGDADVATGSGHVEIDAVGGDLRLRCGSGTARLGEVCGALEAGFGSGELDVGTARGAVRSRAGSGGARLGSVHADVDVAAGSGDVSIGLPAGTSARLDIKTGGHFSSDLPVDCARTGTGPTITVRARTGSGHVRLSTAEAR